MNSEKDMLVIDGSEGGGSILRISLAFSILTKTPIRVINIRAKRPQPGIKEQHLQGVIALSDLCNGRIKGAFLGSKEIEFYPSDKLKKDIFVKISTAGSVGLVLYPLILASIKAKELRVRIVGGATFGKWAPPITFLEHATFEMLRRIGIDVKLNVIRHGFYPKGQAEVEAKILVKDKLNHLNLYEQEEIEQIIAISTTSNDLKRREVAERQNKAFLDEVRRILSEKEIKIDNILTKEDYVDSASSGSCIVAIIKTKNYILASDALGELKIRAEDLGREVARNLFKIYFSRATLDEHLADQLIPFLSLVGNSSFIVPNITEHIKNSIWLSKIFTKREIIIKENKIEIL